METCLQCEEKREFHSRYCHAHKLEKIRERRRKNPQLHRSAHKRWQEKNIDALKLQWREKATNRQTKMREFVDTLKSGPCADCGKIWPPVAMDFDHVRGPKKMAVASMTGRYTKEEILEEVAKCELVCACCHRIRTAQRRPLPSTGPLP